MSIKKFKPAILLCVFLVAIIGFIYVVGLYWPKYEEYFFELALLGRDGTAEGYFPDDNSTIHIGTPIRWQVYVHNHMGKEQDILIKIKLLNTSMQAPNDRENQPSLYPAIYEIPLSMDVDETIITPLSWSVLDAYYNNGTVIKSLIMNDSIIDANVYSVSNGRFRIVFELWVNDQESDEYVYGWYSKGILYSASIHMWYELRLPYY